MFLLGLVAIFGLGFSVVLTRALRDWLVRMGLMDRPGGPRKLHALAVPRLGGVAVAVSYVFAYLPLLMTPLSSRLPGQWNPRLVWSLLPAVLLIFLTGLLDDLVNLHPWLKLAGQTGAAALVCLAGVRIQSVVGYPIPFWAESVITISWLVLCANAFNLIDGIDGLAAGLGTLSSLTIFLSGVMKNDLSLALATVPLITVLLGFLRYNFNPASIFLGDCGSLFIGFLLGCYGIIWSQKSTMFGMTAPIMTLALPLLDVGLSVARRFINNAPLFGGDRGHIHHRLLERGFTSRGVALLLYAVCGFCAIITLLQIILQEHRFAGLLTLLFWVGMVVGVRYLGYTEFEAVRRFLWLGFRPAMRTHVILETFERSLKKAASVEECWNSLQKAGRDLGYNQMYVQLSGERFYVPATRNPDLTSWQLRLNLTNGDFVNLTRSSDSPERPVLVGEFIEVVRRVVPKKVAQFGKGRPDHQHAMHANAI